MPTSSRKRTLLIVGAVALLATGGVVGALLSGSERVRPTMDSPSAGGERADSAKKVPLPTPDLGPRGSLEVQLSSPDQATDVWVTGVGLWPARHIQVAPYPAEGRIDELPPGDVLVWARNGEQVAGPSEPVEILAGQISRISLQLHAAPSGRGQVLDATGEPVAGARIDVMPPDAGLPPQTLITDAQGRFESDALLETPAHVWVRATGFVDHMAATRGEPLHIVLRPTLSLTGVVVDERGAPQAGARVWATGPDGEPVASNWEAVLDPSVGELGVLRGRIPRVPLAMAGAQVPGGSTTADVDGHFDLTGLTSGHVVVHARLAGLASATQHVADAAQASPLRLTLREGGRVLGTVRDARGYEVEGMDVRLEETGGLSDRWTRSDAHGEFRFTDVRGTARVAAFELGSFVDHCTVRVGAGDATDCALVVGTPRTTLRVQVRDPAGSAVAGARLTLKPQPPTKGGPRPVSRLTNPEGVARFDAVALKAHQLDIEATGFVTVAAQPVDPAAYDTLELELEPAGEVEGTVIDTLGAPVTGAQVRAQGAASGVGTDEHGSFLLGGLRAGAAWLVASRGALRSAPTPTQVRSGERLPGLRLVLDGRDSEEADEEAVDEANDETLSDSEPEGEVEEAPPGSPSELDLAQRGAQSSVAHVEPGSPAARAGLREGDIITHVDGEPVLAAGQAAGMLRDPAGTVARVRVLRGQAKLTLRFHRPALP